MPAGHRGPRIVPGPSARLEKLKIHRTFPRVCRKVLPQQQGIVSTLRITPGLLKKVKTRPENISFQEIWLHPKIKSKNISKKISNTIVKVTVSGIWSPKTHIQEATYHGINKTIIINPELTQMLNAQARTVAQPLEPSPTYTIKL